MENLAGKGIKSDPVVKEELERCGIEVIEHPERLKNEVDTIYTGKLGSFTFERAWYYWRVKGDVPVPAAWEMYNTIVGKRDIRVAGNGCCVAPTDDHRGHWVDHKTSDGKMAIGQEDYTKFLSMPNLWEKVKDEYVVCNSDEEMDAIPAYVTDYHIDSELGLYIFVETLKKHNLV